MTPEDIKNLIDELQIYHRWSTSTFEYDYNAHTDLDDYSSGRYVTYAEYKHWTRDQMFAWLAADYIDTLLNVVTDLYGPHSDQLAVRGKVQDAMYEALLYKGDPAPKEDTL